MTDPKQIIDKIIELCKKKPYVHGEGGTYQNDKYSVAYTVHEKSITMTISIATKQLKYRADNKLPTYQRVFTISVDLTTNWIDEFMRLE